MKKTEVKQKPFDVEDNNFEDFQSAHTTKNQYNKYIIMLIIFIIVVVVAFLIGNALTSNFTTKNTDEVHHVFPETSQQNSINHLILT